MLMAIFYLHFIVAFTFSFAPFPYTERSLRGYRVPKNLHSCLKITVKLHMYLCGQRFASFYQYLISLIVKFDNWNEYFPNLLEITFWDQIFVFHVMCMKFWLGFFKSIKMVRFYLTWHFELKNGIFQVKSRYHYLTPQL